MSQLELNTDAGHVERVTYFADVILPVPIPRSFTYRVPFDLSDQADVGFRVIVQFGRKKILTGIIEKIHQQPPHGYQAKSILDVLDDVPQVNHFQLQLFHWMADYYMATIGEVYNVAVPSGLKLSSESKIQLHPAFDYNFTEFDFSEKEEKLLIALRNNKVLTYSDVAGILEIKSYHLVIRSLLAKEAILIFEEIKEKYTPKKEKYIRLSDDWLSDNAALEYLLDSLEHNPKQQDVVLAYLREVPVFKEKTKNTGGLNKKALLKRDISPSSLRTLEKKGIFEEFETIVPRFETNSYQQTTQIELSEIQLMARDTILDQFELKDAVLFQGITGSGKTEIYINLIQEVLHSGQQVLYLVPEIALTTQIVTRLRKVFGDSLGVYHSKFSDNERVEVWKGVISGRYAFVIGVRSAVFLPFDNLGLIVVDEEHELSYKQFDPAPRYHARDTAMVLARIHHAKVLLGSATPSIESMYLAKEGKYGLVSLDQRYGNAGLPEVLFADIQRERKQKINKGDFTTVLLERIGSTLSEKRQVIVFQNRRGYSPYITCDECAWIPKCNDCAVSLTYHMFSNQLRCHYCGHHEKLPAVCPVCGSTRLRTVGFGTEKLEEDLKLHFPEARIQRMDLDTTRRKYSYQKIISEFEQGDIDILVGTQMVSKGLDFERVDLVGIFDIDRMLHFPDFRSFERTFQLSVQVSGRAGRKNQEGLVVIQTANLKQPILSLIASNAFESFYEQEVREREKFHYPPFYRLLKIILKNKQKEGLQVFAERLGQILKKSLGEKMVLGPHEPVIAKIRGKYILEILVKIKRDQGNLPSIKKTILMTVREMSGLTKNKGTYVTYDVDPY